MNPEGYTTVCCEFGPRGRVGGGLALRKLDGVLKQVAGKVAPSMLLRGNPEQEILFWNTGMCRVVCIGC